MKKQYETQDVRAGRSDGHLITILLISLVLAGMAWIGVSYYQDPTATTDTTSSQISQ